MNDIQVIICGLGYVGLPLAVAFGEKYYTYGYDVDSNRIEDLKNRIDRNNQLTADEIKKANLLEFSTKLPNSNKRSIYIITVPTPIDKFQKPDLSHLENISTKIGQLLKPNDIVIYESTVFPGCTEDICVPILEQYSNLIFNRDFTVGYSPERVNPGDKVNTLKKIRKITSGSTSEAAEYINELYKSILEVETHKAPSIKVAEAAKIIENCQRDVNISFMNELSLLFDKLDINTQAVLDAASTKWNFLNFHPGLVGGHCIGVDPYYLLHKAEQIGFYPKLIGAGRSINDGMAKHVVEKSIKSMMKNKIDLKKARVLILGYTFKENVGDTRNTKVSEIGDEFSEYQIDAEIFDPVAIQKNKKFILNPNGKYDLIIFAVNHTVFESINIDFHLNQTGILFNLTKNKNLKNTISDKTYISL
ncbi:nucleotide sugar dehydrogenase [Lacihabitans lacunae]|uniref:Nucleotide sugar dehydrogenase n=1 Tax=Lacihabitans lacunae TaxID=1028214 RepID=A0ABV7YZE5_9BACT